MLPRYLVQDPDTPTYMEELPGNKMDHSRHYEGQQEDYISVLYLGYINCNIDDVAS